MLFQSCVVYHKKSYTLDEAKDRGKVKLIDENGQIYKFENVELIDSVYFGMGREYISTTQFITPLGSKTSIDSIKFSYIYVKNTKKSKRRTVLIAIFALPVAYIFTGVVVNLFGLW